MAERDRDRAATRIGRSAARDMSRGARPVKKADLVKDDLFVRAHVACSRPARTGSCRTDWGGALLYFRRSLPLTPEFRSRQFDQASLTIAA